MLEERIIDSNSRDKIIHNTNVNYFVEAGAGSGKTTVLVERMVAMVEEGKDIEHICAITFTKAAANEFYARFQKRLIERSNAETLVDFKPSPTKLNNPNDLTRCRCKKALANIDLAFMGTIDAFCNMIMSEHPSLSKIPPNSSLISEEESDSLYLREYANIVNGKYNNKSLEDKAKLFSKYFASSQENFITILKFLLDHRNCEIVIPNKTIENLDVKYKNQKEAINKIVKKLIEHPEFITSSNDDNAKIFRKNIKSYRQTLSLSWNDNVSSIINALKRTFSNPNFRLYLDPKVEQSLGPLMDYFVAHEVRGKAKWYVPHEDVTKIVEEIETSKYQVALDFVEEAKNLILKKLRSEGKLTFSDYLIYLRDTLKEDADKDGKLIKHIKERHKYFMIDEFQDTDPIQSEIFFYLASEKISPVWKKCIPTPGSLFIVGDPKQSIYRFKNADVASFLNIKRMFEDPKIGEVLNLYCNFRSTYQIRTWFNNTFKEQMLESDDQSSYPLIPTDISELNEDFSGIYSYEAPKKDETYSEPDIIAQTILKLIDNPKYQITAKEFIDGKEIKVLRKLKWKDFMLITPSKPKLALYTSAFKNYGIPYFVEGNIIFNECLALVELVKIYSAITLSDDNRKFYNALKSKLFNVSESELISLKEKRINLDINESFEEVDLSNNLKKAILMLQELLNIKDDYNPSTLFKKLIEEYGVFEKVGNKNMEYLYFVLEQIKTKENTGEIVSHKECIKYLNDLLDNTSKLERCPGLKKDGDQIHLANLHKVKGLEAPIVILCSPSSVSKKASFRVERNQEGNLGYVFKVEKRDSFNVSVIETSDYEDLKELENLSIEAENLRLAYVGATRARNVLIIASNTLSKGGQSSKNPWKYLLNGQTSSLEILLKDDEVKNIAKENIKPEEIKYADFKMDESLIKPSFEKVAPSGLVGNEIETEDARLLKQTQEGEDLNATIIGTMVHRLMELILISKDKLEKEELIKIVINEYGQDLSYELIEEFKNTLTVVYETMHNGGYKQENKCPEDILKVLLNADEVRCEVPFTYKEDDKLFNGIIDLVYKDKDSYYIIDWKTNKDNTNLDSHYKLQLEAYKKALKRCANIDAKDAYIYHIKIK